MRNFIITVDTEGDNLWAWRDGEPITTNNTQFIPRFQELCEIYGFRPVYLTNYEMAQDETWVRYVKSKAQQGLCEVGMHIHAWNSPPAYELVDNYGGNPYITEYPDEILNKKIEFISKYLRKRFDVPVKVARSGRWATNDIYFDALHNAGFIGDCSFTPEINLSTIPGCSRNIGNDYRNINKSTHRLSNGIVEVPLTTRKIHHIANGSLKHKVSTLIRGDHMWLRPYRKSLNDLLFLSNHVKDEGEDYLEFMIHSSELMPGGSPYFKSEEDIELLYMIMKQYFSWVSENGYEGISLSDYIVDWNKKNV